MVSLQNPPVQAAHQMPLAREYLAFTVGSEEYGVDIQTVQELRSYEAVTQIATAPAFLKGVINLRGTIVPIIDLRVKLGNADPVYDAFTVVVVVELAGRKLGVVVDSVSDVIALEAAQIKPPPAFAGGGAAHILGMGSVGERLLVLVDMEGLVTAPELADISAANDSGLTAQH